MPRILVTGGAGYIGSHAAFALLAAGHEVVIADDLRTGVPNPLPELPLIQANIGDRAAMRQGFKAHGPFDGIIHFAGSLLVAESVENPLKYFENNFSMTLALLEVCLENTVSAFVFSSSAAVYGHPESQPIPEDSPLAPINPYGASKAMVERALADLEAAHGLRSIALRYFNACGADPQGRTGECHDPETHLIPVALEAMAGLRPELALFGSDYDTPDGSCVRDYIHVSDLAEAHVLAIEGLIAGKPSGAYNLGTGTGISNREILNAIEKTTGRKVPFREAERRPGDPPILIADATRFRDNFGWTPEHSEMESIIQSAWLWMQKYRAL